jgi:hypothetical protein
MTFTRFAVRAGIVLIVAFMVVVAIGINGGMYGGMSVVIAAVALVGLIACGNLLYGKNSHGAAATARKRPAQEAQNRAIDAAQEQGRLRREQERQARPRRSRGGTS